MNERIRELIKQVGTDVSGKWMNVDNSEKLAELIVKECLTFCEYQGDRFDEYDSGMTERARIIRESIQEHFGVTE